MVSRQSPILDHGDQTPPCDHRRTFAEQTPQPSTSHEVSILRPAWDDLALRDRIHSSVQWEPNGIRATIDKAGRLVIPKPLRDRVGLQPGEVEIEVDGAALRVEPVAGGSLERRDGWLVIPSSGGVLTSDEVNGLRYGDQR